MHASCHAPPCSLLPWPPFVPEFAARPAFRKQGAGSEGVCRRQWTYICMYIICIHVCVCVYPLLLRSATEMADQEVHTRWQTIIRCHVHIFLLRSTRKNLGCCLLPIAYSCWPWRRKEDGSASSAWRGRQAVGKCTSSCLAVLAAADVATSLATCCAVCVATCVHIKTRVRVTTCVQIKALTCQQVIRC
jgi:hypothetical protein